MSAKRATSGTPDPASDQAQHSNPIPSSQPEPEVDSPSVDRPSTASLLTPTPVPSNLMPQAPAAPSLNTPPNLQASYSQALHTNVQPTTTLPPAPAVAPQVDESSIASFLKNEQEIINQQLAKPTPEPKDMLTEKQATNVVMQYATRYSLTPAEALNSIAYWVQEGGYIKKVPNRTQAINHNNKLEELAFLRECVAKTKPNGTVRQLARALAKQISLVAMKQDYTGHLHKNLKLIEPRLTAADLIFACEFYMGLDFVPPIVNTALQERAKQRQQTLSKKRSANGKGKRQN
jgi:hypothetical protein